MFAERFKLLREQAGLTQTAFARAFGVAQSTVAGWESGSREPNIATVRRLAEYFGVTEDFRRKAVCWYTYGNLAAELYF